MTTRDYTRKDGSKGRSFIKYGEKGSPDIIGIFKGKFLGIECKVPGGRQTIYQKDFQAKIEQAGGIYLLINNPDTLIQWLSDA